MPINESVEDDNKEFIMCASNLWDDSDDVG